MLFFVVGPTMLTKTIKSNFMKAFPNDTILIYKFKSACAGTYHGVRLVSVTLKDGYYLKIYKLSKSAGEWMTEHQIKTKGLDLVEKTSNETTMTKRRNILKEKLKILFPNHYVTVFVFSGSSWARDSFNIKGTAYFEKYGSEVDIILS